MHPISSIRRALVLVAVLLLLPGLAQAQQLNQAALAQLSWRSIGPVGAGGRITDIAVAGTPQHLFVAAATGGLWTSTDNGVSWTPIFDHESSISIGAVAVLDSNPDVIWVGTGEANPRNSVLWGDGIYKSTDGGQSWKNMGLKNTHHIGRIVIDPNHPDTVYVAALGHMWGPNKERGVYKTTDGGLTWTQSLTVDDHTGAVDLAMDPHDPQTIYAAMYQVQRDGFDGGDPEDGWGPGSGIYKTTDGGRNWTKLTRGLPTGDLGRIGLSVSRSNPSVVYAIVQTSTTVPRETEEESERPTPHKKTFQDGGVFRSDDRGESWMWVNAADQRPFYFSQIRVDPNNPNHVYIVGNNIMESVDGGKTFESRRDNIHVDHHAFWIDPADSRHMIDGNDGGVYMTFDAGANWQFVDQMPLSQFYEVDVDNRDPYYVYGGVQDYCSWGGPSATRNTVGIMKSDWSKVMTGDGFQAHPDPQDDNTVYAESQYGGLIRHDVKSGRNVSIKPQPKKGEKAYRFNWETPYIISPHDHQALYMGGNFLFKSTDRGNSWTIISPDLTTDKKGSASTVAESPMRAGLLYVGTDDGNVWVSRDGGQNWKNVTANVPGMPGKRWVSRITPSHFAEGTAYLAFDGHWEDDYAAYLFKTTDYGATWTPIKGDLPANGPVRVIREGLKNHNLLFAGTQFGAFASVDSGRHWTPLMSGLPTQPVADLIIQPREGDLVAATHGRSIYILDDIRPLEEMTPQVLSSDLHVFTVRPAVPFDDRVYTDDQFLASNWWHGENPPRGAIIDYYLKAGTAASTDGHMGRPQGAVPTGNGLSAARSGQGDVKIQILDAGGHVIRELTDKGTAGINRVVWDLRGEPPAHTRTGSAGGGFFGRAQGALVDPGTYTARISAGGHQATATIEVKPDPLVTLTDADRTARRSTIDKLADLQRKADAAAAQGNTINTEVEALQKRVGAMNGVPAEITTGVKQLADQTSKLHDDLDDTNSTALRLFREVTGSPFVPTGTEQRQIDELASALGTQSTTLSTIVSKTIPDLERQMDEAHVSRIGGRR